MDFSIDLTQLIQAFKGTLMPDQNIIQSSELFLQKSKIVKGFPLLLIQISNDNNQDFFIRQAATTHLKVMIDNHWKGKSNEFVMYEEDKKTIKLNLFEILSRIISQNKLLKIYKRIVEKICDWDFPQEYPDLAENVVKKLQEMQSFDQIYAALVLYQSIVRKYEYYIDEERVSLNEFLDKTLPLIQQLASKLISGYNEQSAVLLMAILKTFHSAVHLGMPPIVQKNENLHVWYVFLKTLLDAPISSELLTYPQNDNEKEQKSNSVFWRNKKWCLRILLRFVQKFTSQSSNKPQEKQLSQHYIQSYALPFMESFLTILINSSNQFCCKKVQFFSIKLIFYSLRIPICFQKLQGGFETLIHNHLIPLLYLNEDDISLWQEDPIEFLRKEEDFSNITGNVRSAVVDLIENIAKIEIDPQTKKTYVVDLFQYIVDSFIQNKDAKSHQPLNDIRKESLLCLLIVLKSQIIEKVDQEYLENFIAQYCIPLIQSNFPFMRAKLCFLLGQYAQINWKNSQHLQQIAQVVFQGLNDAELPVKVKASVSLNIFMQNKIVSELLKPHLSFILENYIKLIDIIDSEEVVSSLEGIIDTYEDSIIPYAFTLLQKLLGYFYKYATKEVDENDEEDFGDAEMAAGSCLNAVHRLFMLNLPKTTYQDIEPQLAFALDYVFSDDGLDFFSEGLSCLNLLLYNSDQISPLIWSYFPIICYCIIGIPDGQSVQQIQDPIYRKRVEHVQNGSCPENIEFIIGACKNYMEKSKGAFLQMTDPFGISFLDLLFNVLEKTFKLGLHSKDETDMIFSTSLLIGLLENFPNEQEFIFKKVFQFASNYLFSKKSKSLQVSLYSVFCMALFINRDLSLNLLSNFNSDVFYNTFASLWPHFKHEIDRSRLLLGLSSLLTLGNQIPLSLQPHSSKLLKLCLELTTKILDQREEEESMAEEENDLIKNLGEGVQDDDDEDDEDDEDYDEFENVLDEVAQYYKSPYEDIDEILYFKDVLEGLRSSNIGFYENLIQIWNDKERQKLLENFQKAQEQLNESRFFKKKLQITELISSNQQLEKILK